jgi:hypothetical protein
MMGPGIHSWLAHCFDAGRSRSSDQLLIEGGERQLPTLGEFQIGRVVKGEPVAIGKEQRLAPRLVVGLRVYRNFEQGQIGKASTAKLRIDPIPAHSHGQAVRHLKPPEAWYYGACISDLVKNCTDYIRRFVAVDPGQRGGTVEDKAHGRPSSR